MFSQSLAVKVCPASIWHRQVNVGSSIKLTRSVDFLLFAHFSGPPAINIRSISVFSRRPPFPVGHVAATAGNLPDACRFHQRAIYHVRATSGQGPDLLAVIDPGPASLPFRQVPSIPPDCIRNAFIALSVSPSLRQNSLPIFLKRTTDTTATPSEIGSDVRDSRPTHFRNSIILLPIFVFWLRSAVTNAPVTDKWSRILCKSLILYG